MARLKVAARARDKGGVCTGVGAARADSVGVARAAPLRDGADVTVTATIGGRDLRRRPAAQWALDLGGTLMGADLVGPVDLSARAEAEVSVPEPMAEGSTTSTLSVEEQAEAVAASFLAAAQRLATDPAAVARTKARLFLRALFRTAPFLCAHRNAFMCARRWRIGSAPPAATPPRPDRDRVCAHGCWFGVSPLILI